MGSVGRGTDAPQTQGPQFPGALSLTVEFLTTFSATYPFPLLLFLFPDKNHTSELEATFKLPLGEFWRLILKPTSEFTPSRTLPKLFPAPGMPFLQACILPCPSGLCSTATLPEAFLTILGFEGISPYPAPCLIPICEIPDVCYLFISSTVARSGLPWQ